MSRANYVKHLEHDIHASRRTIDELAKEIYELREQLKNQHSQLNERTHEK